MARPGPQTHAKRQREQEKREKRKIKDEKREQRNALKQGEVAGSAAKNGDEGLVEMGRFGTPPTLP